ncbi:MAG TPA: hypothetical protein VFG59_00925 [Anaeromyxobacter sp.]|nr:hypothetical protein [Anaeromyxobacter sp.]
MHNLFLWPDSPALSVLFLLVVSQVVFWAARVPVHRGLRKLAAALGGGLRLIGRWLRNASAELARRNREVLLEAGRSEAEARLEREFTRLATTFTAELKEYPGLHKRLDESVKRVEEDLKESALTPPEAPGWPEAVEAMAKMPRAGDRTVQKVLDEIHRSAVASEKKALAEYREAMAKRHRILAQTAPTWKSIRALLEHVQRAVGGALGSASRVDSYMERYEKIRRGEDAALRSLAVSGVNLFVISLFVVAVAGAGGLVNFQLVARPMSELVPGGGYIFGMPISMIAALVIILMEVAAGIFVMETLGITHLFPRLSGLAASRRRIIFLVALAGLLLLAAIEASLAILREQLLEADKALALSLAGETARGTEQVAAPLLSRIPVIGQAVLGFILPFILAMIAVPLEMLVESGRHVVGRALQLLVGGLGVLFRLGAHLVRYAVAVLGHVFDIYIVLPLQLERLLRGHDSPVPSPVDPRALRNPTERTAPFKVPR